MKHQMTVKETERGLRLDKAIASCLPQISRSQIVKEMEKGGVKVGGKAKNKNYKVETGDIIELEISEARPLEIAPEPMELEVLYEDDDLLVINKEAGVVVHPGAGNFEGTLVSALIAHCRDSLSGIGGVLRPGIVHRLDKDTSGILVVAKNDAAHIAISEQFKNQAVKRIYNAVVIGTPSPDEGVIDKPIGRHKLNRKKMAIVEDGRNAVTLYKTLERFIGYSLQECELKTGRTHQIRVHMASIGHPVVFDGLYGAKKEKNARQLLHAKKVGFTHPVKKEWMEFESGLPGEIEDFISKHR